MTEQEWLNTADPMPMLEYLREQNISERKMRLLACACCRSIWDYLPDQRSRRMVEVSERFADAEATLKDLMKTRSEALAVPGPAATAAYWAGNNVASGPLWNVFAAAAEEPARKATQKTQLRETWAAVQAQSAREQAALIRDVIGNPFHRPRLTARELSWEGGLVARLAEGIYEESAFDQLPILGDALEEAGCTDEAILGHCRGGEPHVRGCWVVDLATGRT
jgi:hypothetical protein